MKKIVSICTLYFVLCTLLYSCKLETSDNGRLDGFWKLTRVDTLATGGVLDLTESGIFWSVQMNLLSVKDKYKTDEREILFRFNHEGGKLTLSEPREGHQYTGDKEIDDVKKLQPFGINQLTETFTVEGLNSSHMYLSTSQLRLSFTKF
ncbi:MAG: lipocalin-like domain-containing protein [Bacteroidaceae bacterium]|nr:lipocalin-like domain-containing protein [Bacteroidaceae bacterium]